jgi:hypothetical protein
MNSTAPAGRSLYWHVSVFSPDGRLIWADHAPSRADAEKLAEAAIGIRPEVEVFLRDPRGGKAYRHTRPSPRLGRDTPKAQPRARLL